MSNTVIGPTIFFAYHNWTQIRSDVHTDNVVQTRTLWHGSVCPALTETTAYTVALLLGSGLSLRTGF
jgi:hypothetical protein